MNTFLVFKGNRMKDWKSLVFLVGIIIAFIFWPLTAIWSMNILFALDIPYTFWTWLAFIVLNITITSMIYSGHK